MGDSNGTDEVARVGGENENGERWLIFTLGEVVEYWEEAFV